MCLHLLCSENVEEELRGRVASDEDKQRVLDILQRFHDVGPALPANVEDGPESEDEGDDEQQPGGLSQETLTRLHARVSAAHLPSFRLTAFLQLRMQCACKAGTWGHPASLWSWTPGHGEVRNKLLLDAGRLGRSRRSGGGSGPSGARSLPAGARQWEPV